MTTTVKVHVNGRYEATVTHKVNGELKNTVTVGPQEEKTLSFYHDGAENEFTIVERQLPAEEKSGIPENGFSAEQAAKKADETKAAE